MMRIFWLITLMRFLHDGQSDCALELSHAALEVANPLPLDYYYWNLGGIDPGELRQG